MNARGSRGNEQCRISATWRNGGAVGVEFGFRTPRATCSFKNGLGSKLEGAKTLTKHGGQDEAESSYGGEDLTRSGIMCPMLN